VRSIQVNGIRFNVISWQGWLGVTNHGGKYRATHWCRTRREMMAKIHELAKQ